jgi:cell wall-associated NlpC family hydrolase
MDLQDRLEKAWADEGRYRETHRTLTFTKRGLEIGNGTVVVKYSRDDWKRRILWIDGQEERILALLSVAWDQPMPDGIIEHFHSASRAFSKGELSLAHIHLAYTGLQPLEADEETLRLLFMAEGFLRAGVPGNEIRKAWGLGWSNFHKFNPNHYPAGDSRGGQFAPKDGGDGGTSSANRGNLQYVSDVKPGTPRKPGDISAETGQKIVKEAETWANGNGTQYAPKPSNKGEAPKKYSEYSGPNAEKGVAADCSGSVHAIMESQGIDYDYTESGKFAERAASGKIPFRKLDANEDPQPGDVVLYKGHMSIYAGNGQVWSAHREGVKYQRGSVDDFGKHTFYRPLKHQSA